MANEQQIPSITSWVEALLTDHPDFFLVEVRIKPTNNVKVFIDGDQGISIEHLAALNRALYKKLEGSGLFPEDDFSLELSSPGLDEPLKLHRQYVKNIGRKVEVILVDGDRKEGILMAVNADGIELEQKMGKKKESIQSQITFDQIKHTKVCVVF